MKIFLIVAATILLIAVGFLGYLFIDTNSELSLAREDLNAKSGEVTALRGELDRITADLDRINDELDKTTGDLKTTNDALIELTSDYNATNEKLNETKTELESVKKEKADLELTNTVLSGELEDANEEIETLNDNISLYKETFGEVYEDISPFVCVYDTTPPSWSFALPDTPTPERLLELKNNDNAVNPTYAELLDFLRKDTTDDGRYLLDYYVCTNFAETVHNNAEAAGIRASIVFILYDEGPGHAINAFLTTDKGMVYIDCTGSPARIKPVYMDSYAVKFGLDNVYKLKFLFETNWLYVDQTQIIRGIFIYW